MIGIEGSFWGITGDSNLASTLGVEYDSRGTSAQGSVHPIGTADSYFPSNYDFHMNYIDIDFSIRYKWFQVGSDVGIPITGHLDLNGGTPDYDRSENVPKADLNTTIGIFAAANLSIGEWSTGKLNLVMRLDYELLDPISDVSFLDIYMPPSSPYPFVIFSTGSSGPIFLARLGLSYEFTAWRGTP
jgi:hypothetical protein